MPGLWNETDKKKKPHLATHPHPIAGDPWTDVRSRNDACAGRSWAARAAPGTRPERSASRAPSHLHRHAQCVTRPPALASPHGAVTSASPVLAPASTFHGWRGRPSQINVTRGPLRSIHDRSILQLSFKALSRSALACTDGWPGNGQTQPDILVGERVIGVFTFMYFWAQSRIPLVAASTPPPRLHSGFGGWEREE